MSERYILFQAITGSHAYGLETDASDVDRKAVFVAPIEDVLGLHPCKETIVEHEPDFEYHELGKFLKLALKCNPSILELLFMPESCVEKRDDVWRLLELNRSAFLYEDAVRSAYGGYAIQQMEHIERRLKEADAARVRKHARHIFRLFWQGEELLTTGEMNVRLSPNRRAELFEIGEKPIEDIRAAFSAQCDRFMSLKSTLPATNNFEWVNQFLIAVRMQQI